MRLEPNRQRIIEAILFLIHEGERRRAPVTQYEIVKSLFLADVAHFERFGRPITFDNYYALEFGPVPQAAYDMLKPEFEGAKHFADWPLWTRRHAFDRVYSFENPRRSADLRILSRSDVSALTAALDEVKALKFGGLVAKTHADRAYQEAWSKRGDKGSAPMDYALLMGDPERAAEVAEASRL